MISASEMLGGSGHAPRENFEIIDAFRCVIRLSLKKVSLFIIKYIDYSYTPCYTLAMGYFATREILKTCSS